MLNREYSKLLLLVSIDLMSYCGCRAYQVPWNETSFVKSLLHCSPSDLHILYQNNAPYAITSNSHVHFLRFHLWYGKRNWGY